MSTVAVPKSPTPGSGDHLVLLMFVEAAFALAVLGTWALLPREPKVPPSHSHLADPGDEWTNPFITGTFTQGGAP